MRQYFPTRKSLILGLIIWGAILGVLAMTGYYLTKEINITAIIIVTVVNVPIVVIMYAIWFKTGYFVNEQSLIVKIGPYTEREIDIANIISLKRSYNVLASPANSLKRLKVNYRGGMVLISPARENEFLDLLSKLNPRIKIEV